MPEDHDRLVRLEERLEDLVKDVEGLLREVGGVAHGNGEHRSMRRRVHDLETNTAAAKAATAALEAAQAIRRDGWAWWQKTLVTIFAGIGAVGTIVSVVVLLRGGS